MKANFHSSRDMHIDALRRKFAITLEMVSRYNRENMDEIKNIRTLFLLNGDDREKVLVLLCLFSSGEDNSLIQSYRTQAGLNYPQYDNKVALIDKYKVMIVTALIYNPVFYSMTLNFLAALESGFSAGDFGQGSFPGQIKGKGAAIISFSVLSSSLYKIPRPVVAAAGLAVIFSLMVLIKLFMGGAEMRVSNRWVASLIEPQKDRNGIAYLSATDGRTRIELPSPLIGMAMGNGNDAAGSNATVDYYSRAIRRNRNNSALYVNRGIAYTVNGYLDLAVKDFTKAIEIDPQNIAAYYNRAIAYTGKGVAETETAIKDLQTAVGINPDDRESLYALGVLYCWQYENDETKPAALLQNAINSFERIRNYKDVDIILDYLSKPDN
jgi:tetratricopeptide (TPR) repeat protein